MTPITSFLGKNFFLSNFYRYRHFQHKGVTWGTSEHAFQAIKCSDWVTRDRNRSPFEAYTVIDEWEHIFKAETAQEARDLGQKCRMRDGWEIMKNEVMTDILFSKFYPGGELSDRLQSTGDAELIEGNPYLDTTWGCVEKKGVAGKVWVGENRLGKILMHIRELQR